MNFKIDMSEERMEAIKNQIMRAVETNLDFILREEFGLSNDSLIFLARRFITEMCNIRTSTEISSKKLYDEFSIWLENNNYENFSHIAFSQTLERLNFKRTRKATGSFWVGIDLR